MSEVIKTDVLVIGAGPSGLATAISIARKAKAAGDEVPRVVVLDKGRSLGSHVLSGAIVDPSGFTGLLTDEEIEKIPCDAKCVKESFRFISSEKKSSKIPWVPPMMSSEGYPIVSLTKLVAYLGGIASKEGIEIYTGYAVTSLIEEDGRIVGARTGEKGLDKDGKKKSNYLPSEEIRAKVVVLAEGGAGILTEKLINEKNLKGVRPQTYAVGIKELIDVPAGTQTAGETMHTFGYPSDMGTYGGGFVYHVSETQVMVGYVYALDYRKAEKDPYRMFRQFKATAAVASHIKDGKSVAYGAKVIPEGGYYAVPKTYYPGCIIVGDGAGLLDSLRIKGVHISLQSGQAAATAILAELKDGKGLETYPELLKQTSGWKEMKRVRNVRASFSKGMPVGIMAAGLAWMTFGAFPFWRVGGCDEPDHEGLKKFDENAYKKEMASDVEASPVQPDRLTDVFMSGTNHEENQPCHIKIKNISKCAECKEKYGAPCMRFCPAEAYRYEEGNMQIDFSNCLHCKTCRIKCPMENIEWTFPQGGDGPRYTRM
ncbi:MAG: 4Fe-4S dicluster domain-containing protein [Kiritimatiellae bacterium]|nr:4Fe-4S dicluster domain-containing protein [Kiritimatiellia bacterium]